MKLRYNIILILLLILVYRIEQLGVFNSEVTDLNLFTDYFNPEGQGDDGQILLDSNYYVLTREDKAPGIEPEPETPVVEVSKEDKKEAPVIVASTSKKYPKDIKIVDYSIKSGDTTAKIAKNFGIKENILKYHNPKIKKILVIGQVLKVPTENGIIYTVKSNDTLFKIAQKYKVKADSIADCNILPSKDLKIGQKLFIKNPTIPKEVVKKSFTSSSKKSVVTHVDAGFMKPLKRIAVTSPYGNRFHPVLKRYIYHAGVDLQARYIDTYATKSGKISFVGVKSGYGRTIIIDHGGGYQSLYSHLESYAVEEGDVVSQGEVIARTGASGRVTGPHLHFEIRRNGVPVNPMSYINK